MIKVNSLSGGKTSSYIAKHYPANINVFSLVRTNEMRRAKNMIERIESDGFEHFKFNMGKSKNGRNKWSTKPYRKVKFPLIENGIFKDKIEQY